jgi:hypothetical protein
MYVLTATGFSLRLAGVISERDPLDEICRGLISFKLEWDDNYAQPSCCSFLVSFRLEDDNYRPRAMWDYGAMIPISRGLCNVNIPSKRADTH